MRPHIIAVAPIVVVSIAAGSIAAVFTVAVFTAAAFIVVYAREWRWVSVLPRSVLPQLELLPRARITRQVITALPPRSAVHMATIIMPPTTAAYPRHNRCNRGGHRKRGRNGRRPDTGMAGWRRSADRTCLRADSLLTGNFAGNPLNLGGSETKRKAE